MRDKVFVDIHRKPVKVVDVLNDLEEQNNLMEDPKYKKECDRLIEVIQKLPAKDNDPQYRTLPGDAEKLKTKQDSQLHKLGRPQKEAQ